MPVFNVRLSDDEMAAFTRLAGEGTKTALLRRWIAAAGVTTGTTLVTVPPRMATRTTLPFLSAPDDDCASCGHDRHAYHLGGVCTCPVGPRRKCGCPAFVAALDMIEPF